MSVEAVAPSKTAVTGAIRTAANATGVSFDYLLATAKVESDLNPNLTARTSTATGLFQFVDQTWLGTLKQAGPGLGYGRYADAIARTAAGRYEVADPAFRHAVMELRKDPTANSLMGGAFTQSNAKALSKRIGRTPSEGDLYIAHFFGPSAAAKAINLAASNPTANAAEIFPAAARANGSIFYDRQGRARSIAGVCAELTRRYQFARAGLAPASIQVAAAPRPPAPIPVVPESGLLSAPPAPAVATSPAPAFASSLLPAAIAFAADPVATANAPSAPSIPSPAAVPPPAETGRVGQAFHSLFHAADRREAVSPVVALLWGGESRHAKTPAAQLPLPSSQPPNNPVGTGGGSTLDLFRDMPPNVRALFGGKT